MSYTITKNDVIKRLYFITNLVQSQKGSTMQGALTSKSDSMGGICDRFINSLSDDIVFNQFVLPKIKTTKTVDIIRDYYLYKPLKNSVGIAPDVFGLVINGNKIPFTKLIDKWTPIDGMPQIEVKTYKAKDQMISLRNQDYEQDFLVMVDLDLRIDYLVPFLDQNVLSASIAPTMSMDDSIFIDPNGKGMKKVKQIQAINYSKTDIGKLDLISITNGQEFLNQATLCGPKVSPRRMKEIKKRQKSLNQTTGQTLDVYSKQSSRISAIYEFNDLWYTKTNVDKNKIICLDFSASKLSKIEILAFNASSIVVKAQEDGCMFNEKVMNKDEQFIISFETLSREGNNGEEHFMQKQCAKYLSSHESDLLSILKNIIDNN